MKSRKKRIFIIAIMVLGILILFQSTIYAHSGRTDSSGGHKDNKNASGLGSYHYHCGGHPPHLHTNGVCPYNSTKETSANTNSSTSSKSKTTNNTESKIKVIDVDSVKIVSENQKELLIGETLSLSAEVSPSNSTNKTIIWESSNDSIATVTQNGVVEAKSEGSVEILAKANNGVKDSIILTVNTPEIQVANIDLDITEMNLYVGNEALIIADIFPSNATRKKIKWSSSDESVVKVNNGNVIAISSGDAIVTAEAENGIKSICKITVSDSLKSEGQVIANKEDNTNIVVGAGIVGGIGMIGAGSVFVLKKKK